MPRTIFLPRPQHLSLFLLFTIVVCLAASARAQTPIFTYQGKLTDAAMPASGDYDMQFRLFDAGGTQIGATITYDPVNVSNGIFSVQLNQSGEFGATAFNGPDRWLEVSVRRPPDPGYTPLSPRTRITSTPFAIRAAKATDADSAGSLSAACVLCVTDAHISSISSYKVTGVLNASQGGTGIGPNFAPADTYLRSTGGGWTFSGILPSDIPTGSPNYIQSNPATQQSNINFNIGGTGTANIFDASTQYNIGGSRVLSIAGFNNFFAGQGAGLVNTGNQNTFVGTNAGINNAAGADNSFFGLAAGGANTTGSKNSIFGRSAGLQSNGSNNSFFGYYAGVNASGGNNSFFGFGAGQFIGTGSNNTHIGSNANNTGSGSASLINSTAIGANAAVSQSNSLILGSINGVNTATADTNVGIGTTAPAAVLHVIGSQLTDPGPNGPPGITAASVLRVIGGHGGNGNPAGHGADVLIQGGNGGRAEFWSYAGNGGSITLQPGSNVDNPGGGGQGRAGHLLLAPSVGNVGIGTSTPQHKLHVVGENVRVEGNTFGTLPRFSMNFTGGGANERKWQNYAAANRLSFTALSDAETAETFWLNVNRGTGTGISSVTFPNGNVGIGTGVPGNKLQIVDSSNTGLRVHNNTPGGMVGSFGGYGVFQIDGGFFGPNTTGGRITILENGNVGINDNNPANMLSINGSVLASGTITIKTLGAAGGSSLCFNGSSQISNCSSSLRYKQNINSFASGLSLIKQLRPVSFDWKANNQADIGLVAEEVAEVEPLLTTYNKDGEIEGVKYDRVGVVLINAVREQQTQIEHQQNQIKEQQEQLKKQKVEIDGLKKFICSQNPAAEICMPNE